MSPVNQNSDQNLFIFSEFVDLIHRPENRSATEDYIIHKDQGRWLLGCRNRIRLLWKPGYYVEQCMCGVQNFIEMLLQDGGEDESPFIHANEMNMTPFGLFGNLHGDSFECPGNPFFIEKNHVLAD